MKIDTSFVDTAQVCPARLLQLDRLPLNGGEGGEGAEGELEGEGLCLRWEWRRDEDGNGQWRACVFGPS